MSLINIVRDNTDPFYRYKMPPIQCKIEGRGNGIKTAVVNLTDVAKTLNRPPAYLVKYFGFELGAQTSMNETTDRYLVNGAHDKDKLQDTLDGFINKFVLCGSCKNPETDIVVKKGDVLIRECKACGVKSDIDPQARLSSYILKNPPKKITKGTAAANVGGATIADLVEDTRKVSVDDESEQDPQFSDKIEQEALDLLTKKVLVKQDDWSVDMSAEAIAARAKLSGDANPADNKYDEFGEWVLGQDAVPSDIEIFKKLVALGIEDQEKTCQVLAQTLFDENIVGEIKSHEEFLKKVVQGYEHQLEFLGGLERFLGLQHPDLIPKLPKILFELYDLDIVGEDALHKFGTTVSKKYVGDKKLSKKVRRAAKPFMTWLETAEEEESDEE